MTNEAKLAKWQAVLVTLEAEAKAAKTAAEAAHSVAKIIAVKRGISRMLNGEFASL